MLVEINEETYQNLKHCIERTSPTWEPFTDLWPFEIMNIIKKYETTWSDNDLKSHVLPKISTEKYKMTGNPWITDSTISSLFREKCPKCGNNNLLLTLHTKGNTYNLNCKCGGMAVQCIIG
jgi:hypothetical protein